MASTRILHLEDSSIDADLVAQYLSDFGPSLTIRRVVGQSDYVEALAERAHDLILADYELPDFDGLAALAIAREQAPDLPFIFVSGVLGEELAVDALHRGATDYVVKQRLQRLPSAVSRALEEVQRKIRHRAAEKAIQSAEARFRGVFDSKAIGLSVYDIDSGTTLAMNDCLLALMGYTRADFERGKADWRAVTPAEYVHLDEATVQCLRRGEQPDPFEKPYDRSDGSRVWVRLHAASMPGRPEQVVLSVQDITERKNAETERERLLAELRIERARLEQVLEHLPVGLIVAQAPSGKILSYNRQAEEILGHPLLPADRISGYATYGGLHADGRPYQPGDYPVARALLTGQRVEQEDQVYRRGDGRITHLSVSAAPVGAPGEPPDAVVCAFLDVDERLRSEAALRDSEAHFRALAEAMPQLVWTTRPDGYHEYYNARWYDYTGTRSGDTKGEGWSKILHPDDLERTWTVWRHSLRTGEPYEIEYRLRSGDGGYRWFIGRALPMRGEDGRIIRWYGTCTDVEEQKRTAAMLAETKERLRLAQEAAGVGSWEWDVEADTVHWSPATYALYGCDPESWTPSFQGVLLLLHPDDRAGTTDQILGLLDHPRPLDLEFRVVRPDGSVRWVLSRCRPEEKRNGRTTVVRGADMDVTARRAAEERERLLMREVDHRAKNAMAVVQSLVRLTRADTKEEFVAAIEGRVTAMARAHSLLARDKWAGSDLAALIEQELDAFARDQVQLSGPPATFAADAVLPVGLALHELATNAAKYGSLSAKAGLLTVEWRVAAETGDLVLSWRETGGPSVAAPMRRGFGSTLVRASIEDQLGGRLVLDWRAEGLALEMRIPDKHWTPHMASVRDVLEPEMRLGAVPRRVLVVEDSALIAMELQQALLDFGCQVVGPALSLEDARHLADDPELEAAVLDLDLNGQSSLALAESLRWRGVPVLFCSGYEDISAPAWAGVPRLHKPFSRAELMAALRAVARDGTPVAQPSPSA
ncbi:PAS domain S-box protein [Azospirillum sp. SYSU D00513]|uniref:PAS domain S-box protein n=1 Tax=Azospirillum sp. SYSU D00513 TaxID=2812561 RepID=UPI001A9682AA|nr:PAS domain S-box protein [Azospirillum sp. SYSU D00513]